MASTKKTTTKKATTKKATSTNGGRASKRAAPAAARAQAHPDGAALAALEVAGTQQDFELHQGDAATVAPDQLRSFRADASLAYHNVDLGVGAVLAHEARLASELPAMPIDQLRTLPSLALAVSFAAAQVDRGAKLMPDLPAKLARSRELRELLLTSAQACVKAGLLPAREVERIVTGRGPIDAAQDCVDLAALFTKNPAALKKTPVSARELKEAAELGKTLLTVLRPKRTRKKTPAEVIDAAEMRDRLWTLLTQRHALLWRAGAYLFGKDEVDAKVPALQSRVAAPRKRKAGGEELQGGAE